MTPIKFDTLIKAIQPLSVTGTCTHPIQGLALDSRNVGDGFLFIATHGTHQDGWSYVEEAIRRGATVIVSDHDAARGSRVCHVKVADTRDAAARLAAAFHGHPSRSLLTIGVTGTNGKTTTAYLIRDILEAAGRNPGMLGTVEYCIGDRTIPAQRTTPDAIHLQAMLAQMGHSGCHSAIMEVSSHALDQKRAFTVGFDAAIFTNLTRDHLDYHGTLEKYFEAKLRLFTETAEPKTNAAAIVNVDDEWGRRLLGHKIIQSRTITIGLDQPADVMATQIQPGPEGTAFRVQTPWGSLALQTTLIGRFNVYNCLSALAAMGACGIPLSTIAHSLSSSTGAPGRLEKVETGRGFHVLIDYAHSDAALDNVLQTLRPLAQGRVIVVFGCGGNRDRTKRPIMGAIATQLADMTFITSDNPRKEDPEAIIREICAGIPPGARFQTIADRPAAIQAAIQYARPSDIVLIAGKGHERAQELANTIIPMDDRTLVRKAL